MKFSRFIFVASRMLLTLCLVTAVPVQRADSQGVPYAFIKTIGNPPIYVQEAEVAWTNNTSPKTTASFNVLAGDVLVAYAANEEGTGADVGVSGGSLTWTERQFHNTGGYTEVRVWTAVVDTNKSMTVAFTGGGWFGGNVLNFRNSSGVGASSKANSAGAPTLNITTTKANSAIVVVNGDWNAGDGASRAWRTNAGALTETTYHYDSVHYSVYGGYHANAGPIGTYAVGLTAPNSQTYAIIAVEIKGP